MFALAPPQAKRQKLKDSSATAYIGAGPLDGGEGGAGSNGGGGAVVISDGGKDVSRCVQGNVVTCCMHSHVPLELVTLSEYTSAFLCRRRRFCR